MQELRKFVAPEFVFGRGAATLVGRYAVNFGARKPMIVTDPGVLAVGHADAVVRSLDAEGLPSAVFSGVQANPRDFQVAEGARFYAERGCDVIIAVGGGSPMDCAKAIGIASTNSRDAPEFEGVDNVSIPGPPLICVPTTAGTSADVSQFAIINHVEQRRKFAIISKTMVPDVALIDPDLTKTMPPYLTACTGIDALVHAIEALVSTASSRITDLHALEAIRIIRKTLPRAIEDPDNPEYRESMMFASMQAGLAFSNASLGAVHAMAHSVGGYFDFPHGECNAILLEYVVEYNFAAAPARYRQVARQLGIESDAFSDDDLGKALVEDLRAFRESVGIRSKFGKSGVTAGEIRTLARNAIVDPCMITNPRSPTQAELEDLYARSF
jgi:alcohol dehydrogenase